MTTKSGRVIGLDDKKANKIRKALEEKQESIFFAIDVNSFEYLNLKSIETITPRQY